jgi:TonB family protein
MRSIFVKAAFAGLMLATTPAAAAPQNFQAWLNQAVADNMVFPAALERSHESGVATVRFSVGGDGRPTEVAIVESSGYRTIDRAALRTIATLDLPADAPAGPHVAVLQYGTEATFADLTDRPARLDAAEVRARLALRDIADREHFAQRGGASPRSSTLD